jgi:hypothetical protein
MMLDVVKTLFENRVHSPLSVWTCCLVMTNESSNMRRYSPELFDVRSHNTESEVMTRFSYDYYGRCYKTRRTAYCDAESSEHDERVATSIVADLRCKVVIDVTLLEAV